MLMLRAVSLGAILFIGTIVIHGQDVRDAVGLLEQAATPSSPENPIPRRLSAPPTPRVPEWQTVTGRGVVRLQVTLNTSGRVEEIRNLMEPLVQVTAGGAADANTRRAIADAMIKAAASSVRQWTYDPPRAPITFAVIFNFRSDADTVAVQDPTLASPRGGGPLPPAPSATLQPQLSDFAKAAGAVVAIGGPVRPPVLTKRVTPVYPDAAQLERMAGMVVLEVIIGVDGKVRDGRVLRSPAFFDQAAIEAVRQWEYTPTELNGKPVSVVMTVNVTFNLDKVPFEPPLNPPLWPAAEGAVRAGATIALPRQTKTTRPDFPNEARLQQRTGGAVLLELLIGTDGKVKDVRVLRSSPLFDKKAIEAVRKWEFEPTLVNGVPTQVVAPATVRFRTRN